MRRACASIPIPSRSSDSNISMACCFVSPTMVLWTPFLFYPFFPLEESFPKRESTHPLPLFSRKNVILNGLCVHRVQECESKGVTGEFRLGACDPASAEVSRDNTRKVTIYIAI